MRFRKLRIAWSVAWGISCALLIVLWVRSYWWYDSIGHPTSGTLPNIFSSSMGDVRLHWDNTSSPNLEWQLWCDRLEPSSYSDLDERPWIDRRFRFDYPYWGCAAWSVPHWFLIGTVAFAGGVPWIPWSKDFSLRTLLVGTTILAVMLYLFRNAVVGFWP
jgi:hypothetical protein